ncbi:MAG: EndoU domain-containing protein [Actinomycetales bacterium]
MMPIRAALRALLVAVFAALTVATPTAQADALVHVYTYDGHHPTVSSTYAITERGPPAENVNLTVYNADGPRPLGALACPEGMGGRTSCNYDDTRRSVQIARGSQPVERPIVHEHAKRAVDERCRVAAKTADDFVDLASPSRRSHILDGEVRPNGTFGGGHRPGTGFLGKSEFPPGWSDDRIMHEISDVATDPSLVWRSGNRTGDFFVNGTRGGVDIEVLIRNDQIWTGYPTNLPRNPR